MCSAKRGVPVVWFCFVCVLYVCAYFTSCNKLLKQAYSLIERHGAVAGRAVVARAVMVRLREQVLQNTTFTTCHFREARRRSDYSRIRSYDILPAKPEHCHRATRGSLQCSLFDAQDPSSHAQQCRRHDRFSRRRRRMSSPANSQATPPRDAKPLAMPHGEVPAPRYMSHATSHAVSRANPRAAWCTAPR